MKLSTLLISLASVAHGFAPKAVTLHHQKGLFQPQQQQSPTTVAYLFGRKKNDEVLERPEEEMLKLNKPEGEVAPGTEVEEPEKELSETEQLLAKVKAAGTAGFVSYALWEMAFWAVSVPVVVVGYVGVTGHLPDFSDSEDMAKLGAEAFAFVNFARFAVPLRIGLALSTTPWIQENVIDRFNKEGDEEQVAGVGVESKVEETVEK